MSLQTYKKGTIIFRQGDPGDGLYDICYGRVGVYAGYGTPNQKLLAELKADDFFGEMGLLDHAARSATVVVLETGTQLEKVTEGDFNDFFREKPAKVFLIMQQLSQRLRRTTQDYLEACRTVYEAVETEKRNEPRSDDLQQTMNRFLELYAGFDANWMN